MSDKTSNEFDIHRATGQLIAQIEIRMLMAAMQGEARAELKKRGAWDAALESVHGNEMLARAHMQIADELVAHIRRGLTLSQALSALRDSGWPDRLDSFCYGPIDDDGIAEGDDDE